MVTHTPSIDEREKRVYSTVSTIHSLGAPSIYSNDHTLNLINLTNELASLIRDIDDLGRDALSADILAPDIHNKAAIIVAVCLTELDAMQPDVRRAGVSDVQACAEHSMRCGRPLDSLDLVINPTERIIRLIEAMGQLAPYWSLRDNPSPAELQYRNETLSMLAYQAVSALIATNRQYGN